MSDRTPSTTLHHKIFNSPLDRLLIAWYKRLFSIKEIENSQGLQWAQGALLFGMLFVFWQFISSTGITVKAFAENTYSCWPYFQSCGEWFFLSTLPDGYSQTTLHMLFFGLMLSVVYFMWKKDWVLSHMTLLILFVWEALSIFVFTDIFSGNYNYYHVVLTFILLFFPFKLFFLQIVFVLLYFLSATVKFDEGWILGTYFSSLKTGLPLFPDALLPLVTNSVIFMQVVGCWFLLSSNRRLQRLTLVYFVAFHLYSGILVEYRYPATVLPVLLTLFGPWYEKVKFPLDKKSIIGWGFVVLLFLTQLTSVFIPGNERLTLEGNNYGFYMFEGNHQCISSAVTYHKDGTTETALSSSALARNRCNPYRVWFRIQNACKRDRTIERISLMFDHSVNGGPFYRIVDEPNVCTLKYHPFKHNQWIRTPEEGADIIGYPVKNIYF